MDRREALKRAALIMGGVISAPTIAAILNGCKAKPTIDWKPELFTQDQGVLISEVAEIIIPKTDTPGAKETGIPGFIDLMVKDVFTKEERDWFMDGMKKFDEEAAKEYGDPFIELDPEQQQAFVKKIHDHAINDQKKGPASALSFILKTKELVVVGYFTSEAGATKVLQYEAVPGAYHGCLPLAETGNGKTWATS